MDLGLDLGPADPAPGVRALFIGHGTQRLFGWFGGHGPAGTGGMLESLGFRPGRPLAVVTGLAEAGGGLLVALGLLTPLGAAAIIGVMATALTGAGLAGSRKADTPADRKPCWAPAVTTAWPCHDTLAMATGSYRSTGRDPA